MKPNKAEFIVFLEFDIRAREKFGLVAEEDVKYLGLNRVKSLINQDNASIDFIDHYQESTENHTKAMLDFRKLIDNLPDLNYKRAFIDFIAMNPNEIGATIWIMLNFDKNNFAELDHYLGF